MTPQKAKILKAILRESTNDHGGGSAKTLHFFKCALEGGCIARAFPKHPELSYLYKLEREEKIVIDEDL